MNFREMRARLIASYAPFVFFPDDPEVPRLIETRAFTHLVIDEDSIRVYAHKSMEEDLEQIEENYEIVYGEPQLEGEYYVSPYAKIRNINFRHRNGEEILRKAMRKPFPQEVEQLISLGTIIQRSMGEFFSEIKIGMKYGEMRALLECLLLENGAEGLMYPTILAGGKETRKVYPATLDEKVDAGKIIYLDAFPMLRGYFLNFSRVIFTEERREWIDALERINSMYERLMHVVKSGVSCNFVDSIIRGVYNFPHYSVVPASGFYMPYAPFSCVLEENMVFTAVPSVYLDDGVIRVKRNILVEKESMKFLD